MKMAFSTLACPEWSIEQIIEAACAYGYHGVELRGWRGEVRLWKLPEFTSQAEQTAERFRRAGLEICCLGSSANLDPTANRRLSDMEEVVQCIQICHQMNIPILRIFGGAPENRPHHEHIEMAAQMLTQIAAMAGPVTVAFETHGAHSQSRLVSEILQHAKAPNITALWDLHNPYRLKAESPAETDANIGRLTGHTHVKDSRLLAGGGFTYTLPGEGDVPLGEMIGLLKQRGYDGYLSVEWEKHWVPALAGPEVSLPAHAAFLRRWCVAAAAGQYIGQDALAERPAASP